MKKARHPSHVLGICLVALASYVWLNGHALGLLLLEKDVPRFFATAVQGMSRATGGAFLLTEITAGLNALSTYDVLLEPAAAPLVEASPTPSLPTLTAEHRPLPASPHTEPPLPEPRTAEAKKPQTTQATLDPQSAPPASVPFSKAQAHDKRESEPAPKKEPEQSQKAAEVKPEQSTSPPSLSKRSIFDKALSQRYKVMLVGDSFMEDILLAIQRTWYNRDPHVQYISVAKHSTGLCLSTKWDWRKKLEDFMKKHQPHVVVIFIGANDLRNIFDGEKKYVFTSPAWRQRYVQIAEEMLDIVRRGKAVPIWIGLPVMGHEQYAKWVPLIADMQKEAALNKGVTYIETTPFLGDAEGRYRVFSTDSSGAQVRLRKADNYHVAAAGSQMILEHLVPHLRTYIGEKEKTYVSSKKGAP